MPFVQTLFPRSLLCAVNETAKIPMLLELTFEALPFLLNHLTFSDSLQASSFLLQISGLSATFAEIFLEIIQSNLPEGVKLSVREVGANLRRGPLMGSKYG